MTSTQYNQIDAADSPWPDNLSNGIWPRSFALWMAVFYLAMFVIRPWEKLFLELGTIHFERCCAILMIVSAVMSDRFRLRLDFQTFAILLFTGVLCLSGLSVRGLSWPHVFLTVVIFYLVLVSIIRSTYELLFVVACYVVTMGVYLGKSQWEYFVNGAGITEMGVRRLQGMDLTFSNDNALAASVVYSLPMLYFLYQIKNELCTTWPTSWRKWFVRGLAAYAVLASTSIMLTRSRMGAVGLVAFMLLLAMRRGNLLGKIAGVAVLVVVCISIYFVLPSDMQGRLQTMWTSADADTDIYTQSAHASAQGRSDGLYAGIAMFKDYPILGVGLDNFTTYRAAHVDGKTLDAHNLVGAILGEAGSLGVISFSLVVSAMLINCSKVQRIATMHNDDEKLAILGQLALACRDVLILLLLLGQVSYNLQRFNWLWIAAFSLLAASFALARHSKIAFPSATESS